MFLALGATSIQAKEPPEEMNCLFYLLCHYNSQPDTSLRYMSMHTHTHAHARVQALHNPIKKSPYKYLMPTCAACLDPLLCTSSANSVNHFSTP